MSFDRAARIADAVLLEGYVLYPYRATSAKNRYRWTFGLVAPKSWSEAGGCESWWLEAQLLVCGADPTLRGRLRFLSVVERHAADAAPWEEGETREIDFDAGADGLNPFFVEGEVRHEASVVRTQTALEGAIHVRIEGLETPPAEDPLWRVTIRVENLTPWTDHDASRAVAARASFASTHLLVTAENARFISLLDPPPHARAAASSCASVRCWPVLAGEADRDDLVLAAPIVLYDHPQIAPESTGDFFDAGEIDELLALRTRTLTPEEKALARATDARAAAVVDRAEAMTDDELARLHGAVRNRPRAAPMRYALGSRVRLRLRAASRARRTDAQDILYVGRVATVHTIKRDVDGRALLGVIIDEDPAASMQLARGLYHYYSPDEVEPL